MFEPLFQYFEVKSGLSLSPEEKITIEQNFKPRKLRKKLYFLQGGEVCKYMGFILQGATRMFSVDEKGHDHIMRFSMESWWVGDYTSYMLGTTTLFHIEMLEDTVMLVITKDQIEYLIKNIPAVAKTIAAIDKQSAIATQKRIHDSISLTAEERYEELGKTYPGFMQRFPQNMIASYLGVSAETLSRIKKNRLNR